MTGFGISIFDILCVPVFRQNGQLGISGPKFAQKWILGLEFQKSKSGLPINTSNIPSVPIFSLNGQLLIFGSKYFWNSDPKIQFWANLGQKIQSCPFCLKIDAHSISRMQIANLDLDFWNSNPKPIFAQIFVKKSNLFAFPENWHTWHLDDADSYSNISFLNFPTLNPFLCKFGPKKSKLFLLSENWYTCFLEVADSCSNISFLNFKT